MKSMRINSFFGCFELETGGLFFGWFGVIGSLLSAVVFILLSVLIASEELSDDTIKQMGNGQNDVQMLKTGENFKF